MMIVLLDWRTRPVLVQLVLPDQTTIGLPFLSSRTANLLMSDMGRVIEHPVLKPATHQAESLARAAAFVTSQTVTFFGLAALLFVVFFAFLAAFFAAPSFFAALSFLR
jgi:hypothetical protein